MNGNCVFTPLRSVGSCNPPRDPYRLNRCGICGVEITMGDEAIIDETMNNHKMYLRLHSMMREIDAAMPFPLSI